MRVVGFSPRVAVDRGGTGPCFGRLSAEQLLPHIGPDPIRRVEVTLLAR
jgi:hypothetical protein